MHKDESPETLELSNSEITALHCAHAFISIDADADVRCLNHVDIVGSIADCKCDFVQTFSDCSHDLRFLHWTDSAANDALAVFGDLHEPLR